MPAELDASLLGAPVAINQISRELKKLWDTGDSAPTRASLMNAFRNWDQLNPFLLPGNRQKTGGNDQLPIQCERVIKYTDGTFVPVSKMKCAGAAT